MAPVITEECILCAACETECPVGAISEADDIFVIDPAICVECEGYADTNQCMDVCPVEAVVLN